MNGNSFFVILLIFLASLQVSHGIWCFICHTDREPACGDDFRISTSDTELRQECPGSCVKRRGKRKRGSVSRTEVHRSCTQYRPEGCFDEVFNGIEQYTCVCNSDFCNGSPNSFQQSFSIVATLPTAVVVMKYLYL